MKITEFTYAWLHGVSHQWESGAANLSDYDLVICASSWDQRCLCLTRERNVRANTSLLIIFDVRDTQGLRDRHDPLIYSYLKERSERVEQIHGRSTSTDEMWDCLQKTIIEAVIKIGRPVNVLLDISTLPRFLTGSILAMSLARGVASSLTIFYSEGTYSGDISSLNGIFTGERWSFLPIRGLEGHYDPDKNRYFLVSVGFEGSKTLRYVARHEPDRVSLLLADPGYEKSYAEKSRTNNSDLIEYFHIPENQIARAHAGDAIAVWKELDALGLERVSEENVSYLCCGTKPHSLGLMLRAMCLGFPSVLFNVPNFHKVINTQPTGKVWGYELRDITRLPKSDDS